MRQITRCPFCQTSFKVVVDQLRVSDGWVRCGQCKQVFDARLHLRSERQPERIPPEKDNGTALGSPAVPVDSAVPPLVPQQSPIPSFLLVDTALADAAPHEAKQPDVPHLAALPERSVDAVMDTADAASSQAQTPAQVDTTLATEASTVSREAVARKKRRIKKTELNNGLAPLPEPDFEPALESEIAPGTELVVDLPSAHSEHLADLQKHRRHRGDSDELEFIKVARRSAFWHRPLVRTCMVLIVVALTGLLTLQVALHERHHLAASYPAMRPWLVALCAQMQCTVHMPRRIESVVIDSSSFTKARGDGAAYQLQVSLKNTSTAAVAMPALELTLTDEQDQTVLRRVLQPSDVAAPEELAAGDIWSTTVAMRTSIASVPVAGYRLLAFYP